MSISGIITASLMDSMSSLNLNGLLQGKKAKDLLGEVGSDALEGNGAPAPQNPVAEIQEQTGALTKNFQNYSGQANNMMARNFASAETEPSRYITARLESFSIVTMMKRAEESSITSLLDEFGGLAGPSIYDPHGNNKGGGESEAAIRRKLMQKAGKRIMEDAEEDFKKTRERLEDKAEEAVAPKDENGNPIPDATAPNSASAPLAEVVAASGHEGLSEPVVLPDAAPAVTSDPGVALEVATPVTFAAPAAPKISIDILV